MVAKLHTFLRILFKSMFLDKTIQTHCEYSYSVFINTTDIIDNLYSIAKQLYQNLNRHSKDTLVFKRFYI